MCSILNGVWPILRKKPTSLAVYELAEGISFHYVVQLFGNKDYGKPNSNTSISTYWGLREVLAADKTCRRDISPTVFRCSEPTTITERFGPARRRRLTGAKPPWLPISHSQAIVDTFVSICLQRSWCVLPLKPPVTWWDKKAMIIGPRLPSNPPRQCNFRNQVKSNGSQKSDRSKARESGSF